ncbi:hypothetical protein ACLOJK_006887, partial [Asimina triloba]
KFGGADLIISRVNNCGVLHRRTSKSKLHEATRQRPQIEIRGAADAHHGPPVISSNGIAGLQTQIVCDKEGHTTGSVASSYSPAMAEDCPPNVNLENLQLASSHRPINREHQTSGQQATPATQSRRIQPSNPAHLPPNFSATTTSEHGMPSACSGVILDGCDLSRRTLSIQLCKRLYAIWVVFEADCEIEFVPIHKRIALIGERGEDRQFASTAWQPAEVQ